MQRLLRRIVLRRHVGKLYKGKQLREEPVDALGQHPPGHDPHRRHRKLDHLPPMFPSPESLHCMQTHLCRHGPPPCALKTPASPCTRGSGNAAKGSINARGLGIFQGLQGCLSSPPAPDVLPDLF